MYKSAELIGNSIFIKNEKSGYEVIEHFDFDFAVDDKSMISDCVGLLGESLYRKKVNTVKDAKNLLWDNRGKVYGMDTLLNQVLYGHEESTPWELFKIAAIDIENSYTRGVPYDRGNFDHPILSIAITFANIGKSDVEIDNKKNKVVFGYHKNMALSNSNYVECDNESDLLDKFCLAMRKINPDIVTGYNSAQHDIPYIISRMQLFNIDLNKLSPLYGLVDGKKKLVYYNPGFGALKVAGWTHIDYMPLYQKYAKTRLPNYKLDSVAKFEIDRQKVDYSEYEDLLDLYEKNPTKFYEYNSDDCTLLLLIDHKKKFLRLAATIAMIGRIRIGDYDSQIAFWDSFVWRLAKEQNKYIPPNVKKERVDFKGAFVKKTIVGLHRLIATFDAESLYPSIMRALNISVETYLGKGPKIPGVSYAPNGARFRTDIEGIMKTAVTTIFNLRKSTKAKMKDLERLGIETNVDYSDEIETLDIYQLVYKLAINSLYGIHGSEFWRYYNVDIAEAITSAGALLNKHIAFRLNNFVNGTTQSNEYLDNLDYPDELIDELDNIISMDTDSVYVKLDKLIKSNGVDNPIDLLDKFVDETINPLLSDWTAELGQRLNYTENTFNYKREALASAGVWRAKKNYAMLVEDMEHTRYKEPKLKVAGLEYVKVSTPDWSKDRLKALYMDILTFKNPSETYNKAKSEFMALNLKELAKAQKVNGLEKYQSDEGGASQVVKGALAYNQYVKANRLSVEPIQSGDVVIWAYLKMPNPFKSESLAFFPDSPADVLEIDQFVDLNRMFDVAYGSAAETISAAAGFDVTKKTNRLFKFM